jgi:hypothetical protein
MCLLDVLLLTCGASAPCCTVQQRTSFSPAVKNFTETHTQTHTDRGSEAAAVCSQQEYNTADLCFFLSRERTISTYTPAPFPYLYPWVLKIPFHSLMCL